MDKDFFLTAQDVATRLKIAKNTVYELVKREELNYYKVGRKIRFTINDIESYISHSRGSVTPIKLHEKNPRSQESSFIICGQDAMLDVLTAFLERYNGLEKPTLRAYIGSYKGLIALYQGEVQMATSHLWDGDSDVYNLPFVRRLLPGIACVLIHLTYRTQGFYVTKKNPKKISSWKDFLRQDLKMINREKGAGSRVLLDEHLRILKINPQRINGYYNEEYNHLSVAGAVGRGEADLGVGDMKAAAQVEGVDFLPLQKEEYVLVIKKEDLEEPLVRAILEILHSKEFKAQFQHMRGYDIGDIGKIVGET